MLYLLKHVSQCEFDKSRCDFETINKGLKDENNVFATMLKHDTLKCIMSLKSEYPLVAKS